MLDRSAKSDDAARLCDSVKFHDVSLELRETEIIKNISCSLKTSGKTILMGANGAGKSLFLRLLSRLIEPTSGYISGGVNKQAIENGSNIAIIFQRPVLLRRSAIANIKYVLHQQKVPKPQQIDKVRNALKEARLEHCAQTPAHKLSGGEQQRLALARALVMDPAILLLDEATANLDPASTHIVECMVDEASKNGTKIIFVTHDIRQAKRLGDDVLFIHQGKVLVHKSANEFFRDPGSREAQAYLDGRIPEHEARSHTFGQSNSNGD